MNSESRPAGRRLPAGLVYLIQSGGFGFFFALIASVNMIYQFEVAHLNPLQMVLVGTLLESVAFLCEVPTGIVADLYSRRLSVIIGYFLVGLGFLIEGLFPYFGAILLTQVIWGIGITFTSGATEAWIADEVGEVQAPRYFLRGTQLYQTGSLIGTFVSIGLATFSLNWPIVLGAALTIGLAGFLALTMPETNFQPTPQEDRNTFQSMGHTFLTGARVVRASAVLLTILAVILFRGAASETFDRLWQPHILTNYQIPAIGNLEPVIWIGGIIAASKMLTIGLSAFVERRVDVADPRKAGGTVFVLNLLQLGAVVWLGLATNFWIAAIAYLLTSACRTTINPVMTAWINGQLTPNTRATVLSMTAQSDALGQIAGGPVLGWVGNTYSIRAAITASGLLLGPAILFILSALRQTPTAPVSAAEAGTDD